MTDIFLDNRYTDFYFRIIARRRAKPYWGHTENHHIVPESFYIVRKRKGPAGWVEGDSDNPSNKIDLGAKEHFICHWLLTMMTTGGARKKCLNAMKRMKTASKKHNRYDGPITANIYASLKNDIAQMQREAFLGENNPMHRSKGRKRSSEAEARRIAAITGDKNPAKRPEVGKAIGDSKRGKPREPFSDEWIENLCKSNSGEGNGMYGKSHKESSVRLISVAQKDREWIHKGDIEKKIKTVDLQIWLDDEWECGRSPSLKKNNKPKPRVICEHCGTDSPSNAHARYHGDKCKHRK